MSTESYTQPVLEDVNVIVTGQGGDGSLTVITLLAGLLREAGLNVYTQRDVASRIRGGPAAATLRAFSGNRYCIGSSIKLLVAFDLESLEKTIQHLDDSSVVVFDDSGGKLNGTLPKGVSLYSAPFNRLAMRTMRRELYKNSIAFGVVGRILGLEDESLMKTFEDRFKRMGKTILEYNKEALRLGLNLSDELGLNEGEGLYRIKETKPNKQLLISGNESVSLGFLAAGGRFFAGYPITPSSEILESLQKWLPQYGGVARQTEDELAGINMAIGAALTGTRSMVATSGPGFSLMQEGIGHAGSAEIPIVIVDCQRSGPSTGMPTKPEQSDLNLMVFGGHGDFPRVVLAPGHPEDCFYLAVEATNLSQKYQCPVFLAMDQALSQNTATVQPYDLDNVVVDQGLRLDAEELENMEVYKRYSLANGDVSPYSVPGTPGGLSLVTGNEHDEFGLVSTDPENRIKMMNKRMNKIEKAKKQLPTARHFGNNKSEIGFIGIGMTYGVILEAMELLKDQGVDTQYHQPRTIWPILDETLSFIKKCKRVYVVEHNAVGQLAHLFMHQGANSDKLVKLLKYDGTILKPSELAYNVMIQERNHIKSIKSIKSVKSVKKEATLQ
jgi:2-oxoglutarate ferredoxin oxidoreductase subunit alpha